MSTHHIAEVPASAIAADLRKANTALLDALDLIESLDPSATPEDVKELQGLALTLGRKADSLKKALLPEATADVIEIGKAA